MLVNVLSQDVKMGPFMDFEVKKNMRMAPICRVPDLDVVDMAKHLDEHIASQVMSSFVFFASCIAHVTDLSAMNSIYTVSKKKLLP